jgi:hypothetical protein
MKKTTQKKQKEPKPDLRPRFGWTNKLDNDPQQIWEKPSDKSEFPVVVIRLPFMSSKIRKAVREFSKNINGENLK